MNLLTLINRQRYLCLLVLLAGAMLPLSFAPYTIWPVAIFSLLTLFFALQQSTSGKTALLLAFCFGIGLYTSGVYWIFISIYKYGNTPATLAVVMTALFITAMALLFALPFYLYGRWLNRGALSAIIALPALWILGEWSRAWLFTGFPWLYLGYGHIHTWLSGWAPISGVMGLSFIVAFTASSILFFWSMRQHLVLALSPLLLSALCWISGCFLMPIQWTSSMGEPVKVGMAQGNIPQDKKWDPDFLAPTMQRYLSMTEALWDEGSQWIIWPEAAIPLIKNYNPHKEVLAPILQQLRVESLRNESALITGILDLDPLTGEFYNSITGMGLAAGVYYKQRLVPFGEYVPFEKQLRGLISFFNLPTSIVAVGPLKTHGIQIGNAILSPSICYEIVYADSVAQRARNANALITISNDGWFGDSNGPWQHMQIAQMRALETDRYLIRATNTGVSGFVDNKGNLISSMPQFVEDKLVAEVDLRRGLTPFMRWGSEPIVFLAMLLAILSYFFPRRINHGAENKNAD